MLKMEIEGYLDWVVWARTRGKWKHRFLLYIPVASGICRWGLRAAPLLPGQGAVSTGASCKPPSSTSGSGRQEPGWKRNTNRPLGEKAPKRPSAYGVVGVLSHRQNSSSGQSWHHGGVTLCLFWYAGLGAQLKKCIAIPAHLCKAVCFLILPTLSYIQYLMQDNPIFKKT